ncbi:S24 family peptidase [Allosphingosinicella indica]|nr:helix-turn-helix transcriptional regulator [Allosphingosinicella indica]
MAEPQNSALYDALMAVKPPELTRNAWAMKAGVNRSVFADIKSRGNAKHDTLDKLLDAIGVSFAQFDAGRATVRTEVAGTGIQDVRREFLGEGPSAPLPLLGSAMGSEFGDIDAHIEMTELHVGEVLDYLARPATLREDQNAYALTIIGDSMFPRFKPGERAAVSPRQAVHIGDDVIVQLRAADGEDERVKMVLVKELVRRSAAFIELRQYNPDVTFRIEANRVKHMHRVSGRLF